MQDCIYIYNNQEFNEIEFKEFLNKNFLELIYEISDPNEIEGLLDPLFEFMKQDEKSWFQDVFLKAYPKNVTDRGKFLYTVVNSKRFGSWSKAGITLYKNAAKGTAYLEAWLEFTQLFLTRKEKFDLYREAIKYIPELKDLRLSDYKDLRKIEGYLADDFMNYGLSNKVKSNRPVRNSLFRKILNWLEGFFGVSNNEVIFNNKLNELYENLRNGKLDNYSFNEDNILFTSLDRYIKGFDEISKVKQNREEVIQKVLDHFDALIGIYARYNRINVATLFNNKKLQEQVYKYIQEELNDKDTIEALRESDPDNAKIWEFIGNSKNFKVFRDLHYNRGTFFISEFTQKNIEIKYESNPNDDSLIGGFKSLVEKYEEGGDNDVVIENGELVSVKEEDQKRDSVWNLSGNEFNSMDTAYAVIKFLIKSLPKVNQQGEIIPNNFGFYELIDFTSTWNLLVSSFNGLTSYEEMYNKLNELSDINPSLKLLYNQLPSPNKTNPTNDESLIMQRFRTDLGRFNTPIYINDTVVERKTEQEDKQIKNIQLNLRRSSALALTTIKNKFQTAWLKDSLNENNIFVRDFDGEKYLNVSKIVSEFGYSNIKVTPGDSSKTTKIQGNPAPRQLLLQNDLIDVTPEEKELYINNRLDFLKAVGFYFSENTINSPAFRKFIAEEAFSDGIGSFLLNDMITLYKYNYVKIEEAKKKNTTPNLLRIDNPINFASRSQVLKLEGNKFFAQLLGNGNKITEILNFEKVNSGIHYSESAYNAAQKIQYEASLYNTQYLYLTALNNFEKYPTYQSLIANPEFSHFDINKDPNKRSSIRLNSLFDLSGGSILNNPRFGERRRERKNLNLKDDEMPFVQITAINYSGMNLNDALLNTPEGINTVDMESFDRTLMNIKNVLIDGFSETMRMSDKSTAVAFANSYWYVGTKNRGYKKTIFDLESHLTTNSFTELSNPQNLVESEFKNFNFIFSSYLKSELERIYKLKKLQKNNKLHLLEDSYKRAIEFNLFDKLLSPVLKEKLINDIDLLIEIEEEENNFDLTNYDELEKSFDDFIKGTDEYKDSLNKSIIDSIGEYLENSVIELQNNLYNYGLPKNELKRLLATRDIADTTLLRSYLLNQFILNIEDSKLIFGDTAFFKEVFHRLPMYASTGNMADVSESFINSINEDPNYKLESKLNKITPNRFVGKVRSAVVNDIETSVADSILDNWISLMKKRNHDPEQIKDIEKEFKNNSITESDAQGIASFNFYRLMKKSIGFWYDEHETGYELIIRHAQLKKDLKNLLNKSDNKRKISLEEFQIENEKINDLQKEIAMMREQIDSIVHLYPPQKLGYGGPIANEHFYLPGYDKFSIYPLLPGLYEEDSNINELNDKLLKEDIDYITFDSTSKVVKLGPNNKLQNLYADNNRNITSEPLFITEKYLHYYKEQLQIEPGDKHESTFGSQFRKLLFSNKFNMGVPIDYSKDDWETLTEAQKLKASELYSLYQLYNSTLQNVVDYELEKLLEYLGADLVIENGELKSIHIQNYQNLIDLVLKEADKKKAPSSLAYFLELDKSGKLKYPIEASKDKNIIKDILLSIVNNKLVKQKINGEPLIQAAQTGHEFKFGAKGYDDTLKVYDTINIGNDTIVTPMEVMVSFNKNYEPLLSLIHSDGYEIKTVSRLNEMMRDKEWKETNKDYFTFVGYRIPTQAYNSLIYATIKQFLPTQTQNLIVLPSAITTISGSDFDIDKMSIIRPFFTSKGEILRPEKTYLPRKHYTTQLDILTEKINKLKDLKVEVEVNPDELLEKINSGKRISKKEYINFYFTLNKKRGTLKFNQSELTKFTALKNNVDTNNNVVLKDLINKIKSLNNNINNLRNELSILEEIDDSFEVSLKETSIEAFKNESKEINSQLKELNSLYDEREKVINQLYYQKEAQNNIVLDIAKKLLSREDSLFNMVYPNSVKLLKDESKNMMEWMGKNQGVSFMEKNRTTDVFNPVYIAKVYDAFMKSGESLGIAALSAPLTQLFQKTGAYLNDRYLYGQETYPTRIYLNHNRVKKDGKEYIDLGNQYDATNKIQKSEIFSQYITAYVDSQKDPFMLSLNAISKVAPVLMHMAHVGVPIQQAIYLVNQQSVRQYIEGQRTLDSPMLRLLKEKTNEAHTKLHVLVDIWNKYTPGKPLNIDRFVEIDPRTNKVARTYGPKFYMMLHDEAERNNKDSFANITEFLSIDNLKSNLQGELDDVKKDRTNFYAFLQFVMLENQSQAMRQLTDQMKFDTRTNESISIAKYEEDLLNETLMNDNVILPTTIIKKLTQDTEIAPFNVRNVLSLLFSSTQKVLSSDVVQATLSTLLNDSNLKKTNRIKRRLMKEFENDILLFIVQNSRPDNIDWSLIKEGENNIATRFINLISKYDGVKTKLNILNQSPILANLAVSTSSETDFKTLKWIGDSFEPRIIDRLTSHWRFMLNLKKYPDVREFFIDLGKAVYLSYGENRSVNSFFNIIPSELHAELMLPYIDEFLNAAEETPREDGSDLISRILYNFVPLFKLNNASFFQRSTAKVNDKKMKQYRLDFLNEFDPILISKAQLIEESDPEDELSIDELKNTKFINQGAFKRISKALGTIADTKMRGYATGVLVENQEKVSSSWTSLKTIANKKAQQNYIKATELISESANNITKAVSPFFNEESPIIMLARNSSLQSKPLEEDTKAAIDMMIDKNNAHFIFGNSPTDRPFLNHLLNRDYTKFTVFGYESTKSNKRISLEEIESELENINEESFENKNTVGDNKPKGEIVLKIINDWVLSGKATTTVRNPSYHNTFYKGDGVYLTDQKYPVEIRHMGLVKIINDRVVGKYVNYSKEEFAEKEGFETWDNFVENSKYAGQSLIKGESVHLYSIKPYKVNNQELIDLLLSKIKANFDTYLPQLQQLDINSEEDLDNYPDKNKIYYTICNFN